MKQTEIILLVLLVTVIIGAGGQIYNDNLKIESLEKHLATTNLHYEWVIEIGRLCLETGKLPPIEDHIPPNKVNYNGFFLLVSPVDVQELFILQEVIK